MKNVNPLPPVKAQRLLTPLRERHRSDLRRGLAQVYAAKPSCGRERDKEAYSALQEVFSPLNLRRGIIRLKMGHLTRGICAKMETSSVTKAVAEFIR